MTRWWGYIEPGVTPCDRDGCGNPCENAWATEYGWVAACTEHKAEAFATFTIPPEADP